jgi:hypothetical protein
MLIWNWAAKFQNIFISTYAFFFFNFLASLTMNISVPGVWHSVVLYFVPYFMLLDNPIIFYNNTPMEMVAFGTFIFHCVVCVANLKVTWICIIQVIVRCTWIGTIMVEILHIIYRVNTAWYSSLLKDVLLNAV